MAVNAEQRELAYPKEIRRVRYKGVTGELNEQAFDANVHYVISDENPYLDLEIHPSPSLPLQAARPYELANSELEKPDANGWCRWSIGKRFAADRRVGLFELELRVPQDTVLRCYVIPSKLLNVADLWSMIEAVEAELEAPVAWDPDSSRRIRSWAQDRPVACWSITGLLVEAVREELLAAQGLRRNPPLEPGRRGKNLEPAPELTLISQWAVRRARRLAQAEASLALDLREQQLRGREQMPEKRRVPLRAVEKETERLLGDVRTLRARVLHQVIPDEIAQPITFGLLTQRDLRFRRLLSAFAPPSSQLVSESQSPWSRLPPISLNDLFERWGAVWIVNSLRRLGFQGRADKTVGTERVASCTWNLRRGAVNITLDYEAQPAFLSLDGVPPVEERDGTAETWAAARQFADADRPLFGLSAQCSPDYVLRFQGPGGYVLAVGDACLADPAYHRQPEKSKVAEVAGYQKSIVWYVNGRAQHCDPLGGFVLFPGPTEQWIHLANQVRSSDVWICCPIPRSVDVQANERFACFAQRMIRLVSAEARL